MFGEIWLFSVKYGLAEFRYGVSVKGWLYAVNKCASLDFIWTRCTIIVMFCFCNEQTSRTVAIIMKYLIGIEKLQKITDYKIHTLIKPVKKDCIVIAKLITK